MSDFSDFLFHAAWWMLAVAAGGGVVAFVVGSRRLDKKLQRLGIALVLVAGVVAGLRLIFPTDREKMEKRSRELVKAADAQDWNSLRVLLDADTSVSYKSHLLAAGKDNIVRAVQAEWNRYTVKSVHIIGLESEQTETLITVSLEIYSTQDFTEGRPALTSWQLDYQESGDQWILEKITLVRVGQTNGDDYSF
ncbi:MAG TPA: hypothetical protein VHX86_10430 [Tepidisphaeraceae bacterium]|jgi:hypothetical protein|nr:hypothetical protein [Tepidisphaeraceae bacterium]